MSKGVLAAAGVSTLVVLSACSPSAGPEQLVVTEGMSPEQVAAILDNEVTADEYEAGFQRFRACLAEAGYELVIEGELNETYIYGVPVDAVDTGVDARCYGAEFEQIDMAWQLAREDTSYSAQVLRECLIQNGITPEDTMAELVQQLQEAGIPTETCQEP